MSRITFKLSHPIARKNAMQAVAGSGKAKPYRNEAFSHWIAMTNIRRRERGILVVK